MEGTGTVCQGILAASASRPGESLLCFSLSSARPAARLLRCGLLCILSRVNTNPRSSLSFVFFFAVP